MDHRYPHVMRLHKIARFERKENPVRTINSRSFAVSWGMSRFQKRAFIHPLVHNLLDTIENGPDSMVQEAGTLWAEAGFPRIQVDYQCTIEHPCRCYPWCIEDEPHPQTDPIKKKSRTRPRGEPQ